MPSQSEGRGGGVGHLYGGRPAALGTCPSTLGTYLTTVGANPGYHHLRTYPTGHLYGVSPAALGTCPYPSLVLRPSATTTVGANPGSDPPGAATATTAGASPGFPPSATSAPLVPWRGGGGGEGGGPRATPKTTCLCPVVLVFAGHG